MDVTQNRLVDSHGTPAVPVVLRLGDRLSSYGMGPLVGSGTNAWGVAPMLRCLANQSPVACAPCIMVGGAVPSTWEV